MGTIAQRSKAFAADEKLRHMPLTLVGGLDALKKDAAIDGEQRYAWPMPGERDMAERGGYKNKQIYEEKIDAARLDNAWLESLRAAAAVPFVNEPTLEGWTPSTGDEFAKSVDDQGRSLHGFWADTFFWKLAAGVHYCLVDMPPEKGGFAYWTSKSASDVLDVKTALVDGKQRAMEARIAWTAALPAQSNENPEEWAEGGTEERVRVYRVSELVPRDDATGAGEFGGPVHFRESALRKTGEDWKWIWVDRGVLTEIPLVPFYGDRLGPYRGRSPFLATASLQMALWRKTLDYDGRERRDARNLLVITGAEQGTGSFDGNAYWLPEGAEAELKETTGAALKALRDSQADIKAEIRSGNLRPVLQSPQITKTATEITTVKLTADSLLEMWVVMDIKSIERCLQITAILNGEQPSASASVDLPHDFSIMGDGIMEKLLDAHVASGGLLVPPDVVWPEMARRQWFAPGFNADDVARRVQAKLDEKPTAGAPPVETETGEAAENGEAEPTEEE
jgi:hypothetical protein